MFLVLHFFFFWYTIAVHDLNQFEMKEISTDCFSSLHAAPVMHAEGDTAAQRKLEAARAETVEREERERERRGRKRKNRPSQLR